MNQLLNNSLPSNYINYLYEMYGDKDINENNYNKILNIIIKIETNTWSNLSETDKRFLLEEDPAFNKIEELSSNAYEYAINKGDNPSISMEEAKKLIHELIMELKKVKPDFYSAAESMVSESIIDLNYAAGNNDVTSFRFNHHKQK